MPPVPLVPPVPPVPPVPRMLPVPQIPPPARQIPAPIVVPRQKELRKVIKPQAQIKSPENVENTGYGYKSKIFDSVIPKKDQSYPENPRPAIIDKRPYGKDSGSLLSSHKEAL